MKQRDNETWVYLKKEINKFLPTQVFYKTHFDYSWYNRPYLNVLLRLGYIKPAVEKGNHGLIEDCYTRVKKIPKNLKWKEAKERIKGAKKLNRGKKPFSDWNFVVQTINNCKTETFNTNDLNLTHYNMTTYVQILKKIEYLEKIDKFGTYKILDKIPENLTSSLATKFAYDNLYKRKRKIDKLKENLIDKRNI